MSSKFIISDEIYGDFEVEEVLYELINSDAIKRLRKIHQGGATFLVNNKWNVTREEHSIGVMIIMKILGRDINEQILGLLHDVSHTAFSHVVDYVLDNREEDFHEQIYREIIESSEIPRILSKHNINYKEILSMESTVLDSPLPSLCVDRIDYTIRDMYSYGYLNKQQAMEILNGLKVIDNRIYARDIRTGRAFTELYCKEVIDYFMNPLNVFSNAKLTEILKKAINYCIIDIEDFKSNDFEIINKIMLNSDLKKDIESIHQNVKLINDEHNYSIHRVLKPRMVDPSIALEDGSFVKTSEIDNEMKLLIESSMEKLRKGIYLREIIE
ncbi:MAG: HD domain-containing protein [Paraclostridium sp.]